MKSYNAGESGFICNTEIPFLSWDNSLRNPVWQNLSYILFYVKSYFSKVANEELLCFFVYVGRFIFIWFFLWFYRRDMVTRQLMFKNKKKSCQLRSCEKLVRVEGNFSFEEKYGLQTKYPNKS